MSAFGRLQNLVLDTWANLTYKRAFDNPRHAVPDDWVPPADLRRLVSYRVLAAYRDNVAREHIPTTDVDERGEHREYGDADLIVHRVVAGLVGDDMQIVVDGADDEPADTPTLPPEPDEPGPDASVVDRAVFDAATRVWQQRAVDAVAGWEAAWAALPGLQERQEWLRSWADDELFEQAVWECELDVVALGDGVYVLEVSTDEQRVKLDVYDPGFYFPVLDEDARRRGFPTTVHLAFGLDLDGDGQADHVRRITWELGFIEGERDPLTGELLFDADTFRMVPREGDSLRAVDGHIVRRYPWAADEESIVTCYKTDATWLLKDVSGRTVYDFPLDPRTASFVVNEDGMLMRRLDLRQDFVPVVHTPNTPSRRDHFGRSTLGRVLQVLDDLADTDTDLQAAAALAGTPMVAFSGAKAPATATVRPGATFSLGENGRMDSVDLSPAVTVLLEVKNDLEDRLGVNAQVPGEVTGRVEDAGADSGFARLIKLGPYTSLINLLRLVREPKGRLLLKFVQRMSQAAQFLPPGPTPTARLAFGSFLPADRRAAIDEVVAMLQAKAISRRTALQMLVDVGVDIGDIADELARIDAEDIAGARELFEATGDQGAVNARLGITPAPVEPPPVPQLPPVA